MTKQQLRSSQTRRRNFYSVKINKSKLVAVILLVASLLYIEWGLATTQGKSLLPSSGYTLPFGWQQEVPFEKVICVGGSDDWPFETYRENGESYCDVNNLANYIDLAVVLGFFFGLPILVVELADRLIRKVRPRNHD